MSASKTPAWFNTGHQNLDDHFPDRTEDYTNKVWRFWLKEGESHKIIFLDDSSFQFKEHSIFIDKKMVFFTCLASLGQACPLCEAVETQAEKEFTIRILLCF